MVVHECPQQFNQECVLSLDSQVIARVRKDERKGRARRCDAEKSSAEVEVSLKMGWKRVIEVQQRRAFNFQVSLSRTRQIVVQEQVLLVGGCMMNSRRRFICFTIVRRRSDSHGPASWSSW